MLRELLLKTGGYEVAGVFGTVAESVYALPGLRPTLVFLDMELPDGKGFDMLQKIPEINFEVIVTTQHDSFMLDAIHHSALDYLIKPVSQQSLETALSRFHKTQKTPAPLTPATPAGKIILPMQEGLVFVNIAGIIRLESDGAYTAFYCAGGQKYVTSRNISTYENQLSTHAFFRVHNRHLINMNHVSRYVRGDGGYVIMSDNSSVEVARRKKEAFLQVLGI